MRYRTLEIRWHVSKPIGSCDFQPVPFKKARHPPGELIKYATQSYRLATAGEDNHVRLWLVHPNITPPTLNQGSSIQTAPRQGRVEYLSTLSRHSAAVNVVRFSPNGESIASAGDDGMVIIWTQSVTPQAPSFGDDPEDGQYDKEHWKARITFKCTTMQVYDLAWSPNGDYLITGSTDNVARIFSASDGKCVFEIAEHSHYVQGVAWDPLNEYIATQSSDRSMHIYRISDKNGAFEVHAIGKNTRMPHRHSRTPSVHGRSSSRPRNVRRESMTSDAESTVSELRDELGSLKEGPPTPASVTSTPSMFPPPMEKSSSSRRSSFSGSNAPGSPSTFSRYGRSPSPMPALPAIRTPPASSTWSSVKLYGDESYTTFFRRLSFSPDGAFLLTPAGQFEDPSVQPVAEGSKSRGRARDTKTVGSTSCVYIYSRANFARPPIGQLPGHQKPSVVVRYSPILYELRPGVAGVEPAETKLAVIEKDVEGVMDVDVVGQRDPVASPAQADPSSTLISPRPTPSLRPVGHSRSQSLSSVGASPLVGPIDTGVSAREQPTTGSVFALPYRMLYAVLTMDSVAIYDTQQSPPLCLLTKLHYDEFTDATWSPDGQCLFLTSRDGYCTLITFDDIIPAYHTQQRALQIQTIAQHNSVVVTHNHDGSQPNPRKRHDPPLTPAASVDGDREGNASGGSLASQPSNTSIASTETATSSGDPSEPPKKKRRVALTRIGDLDPSST